MGHFHDKLRAAWATCDSLLCVGVDPDVTRFPASLGELAVNDPVTAIERFCIEIVDATADLACAFKPQIAHFAAHRAERALEAVCAHIRDAHPDVVLLLDAKRGDIGSTAEFYAEEAFGRYRADAVTYSPYLGTDTALPLLARGGVVALCRTSNPGSADLQDLDVGGRPLYQRVAELVADTWATHGDCALVVGATWPEQLAAVRAIVGDLPILLPGIGAQGGDIAAAVAAGVDSTGAGLLASSSREILYASADDDFATAARAAAERTRDAINAARPAR